MIDKIFISFVLLCMAALVPFLLYFITMVAIAEYHKPTCLQHGYSRTEVAYNFEIYCIDKNETVIPIGDIK